MKIMSFIIIGRDQVEYQARITTSLTQVRFDLSSGGVPIDQAPPDVVGRFGQLLIEASRGTENPAKDLAGVAITRVERR